jgi:hypothetical protein
MCTHRHRRDDPPAAGVPNPERRSVRRRPAVPPLAHCSDNLPEVESLLGETVLRPRGVVLVWHPFEDAVLHEPNEPLVEDVARDSHAGLQVIESRHAQEGVPDDQQRPPLADHLEALSDGAVHGLAEVLARAKFEAADPKMAGYWDAIFPGEVPAGGEKVLPQLLTSDTIDLEGNELRVIRIGQADTAESTVLQVPSLAAVVTGDLAYNGVHMMTAEAGESERAQWIANLDKVAALEPTFVVAGHKKVDNDNDPKIIGESQQYLRDFSRIAAEGSTAAGIVARMVERYPD